MNTGPSDQDPRRDEILRLFLKSQVMLSAFVYSLVEDWEIAEEAVQETAVFICSRWQDFTPGTNFDAWARSVARLRTREIMQRKRRGHTVSLEVMDEVLNLDCIAATVNADEWSEYGHFSSRQKEALAQCVKALPEPQREIISLHYQHQIQCDRIASRLRKSVESIYMTLTRARKRLRHCVEQRLAHDQQI